MDSLLWLRHRRELLGRRDRVLRTVGPLFLVRAGDEGGRSPHSKGPWWGGIFESNLRNHIQESPRLMLKAYHFSARTFSRTWRISLSLI